MARRVSDKQRTTIDFFGLRGEIEGYSLDPEWQELEFTGKVRSLIRRGLNKTPFTRDFVRQAVKFALGMKLVGELDGWRQDEAWTALPVEEKLSRLVEYSAAAPSSVQQVVVKYWDLLAQTELPAKRLDELRKGGGDRLTEEEVQAIAQVVPAIDVE